jgi:GNAT superfamily N-acetyltransferase
MQIRAATVSDASSFAALVRASEAAIIEEQAAAAPFWESMSEQAHAQNLASARYRYWVAESEGSLRGFVAMRDESHLFSLFVGPEHQRKGLGRQLWQFALSCTPSHIQARGLTVNASLNAVGMYPALGFLEVGEVIRQHGIAFRPMLWQPPNAA